MLQKPIDTDLKLLKVAEVVDVLRVSKTTVYRLMHDGTIRSMRVGRGFRIPEAELLAYLKRIGL